MDEKIIQVSGFGVNNTSNTQSDFMVVALTNTGRVVITLGDKKWVDISPTLKTGGTEAEQPQQPQGKICPKCENPYPHSHKDGGFSCEECNHVW